MFKCIICNQKLGSKGISSHLRRKHDITNKEYYDLYLRKENEGICPICKKETSFDTILTGYRKYCSTRCLNLDPETRAKIEATNLIRYNAKGNFGRKEISQKAIEHSQSKEAKLKRAETNLEKYGSENPFGSKKIIDKIIQYNLDNYGVEYSWQREDVKESIRKTNLERYNAPSHMQSKEFKSTLHQYRLDRIEQCKIDNNCTRKSDLIDEYGSGWYQAGIVECINYSGVLFVRNEDIDKIIQYFNRIHTYSSRIEKDIVNYVKTIYNDEMIENSRNIIHPMELDLYLPKLKLAVEYNGKYWHSIERGISKDYHLRKSLKCREKGIRLIHIYEFEDIDKQKELLKSLIEGEDRYPENDFNKNNFLDIPQPAIIYKNGYTIYGAGKLY